MQKLNYGIIMMHCSNLIQFACNTYNIDFLLHVSQKHQERNVNQIKRLLNWNLISLKLQKKELSNLNTFVLNSLLLGIFIQQLHCYFYKVKMPAVIDLFQFKMNDIKEMIVVFRLKNFISVLPSFFQLGKLPR